MDLKGNAMPKILIVDDEKENREALGRALGDEGSDWNVVSVESEAAAEDLLRKSLAEGAPFDVAITDLVMENEQSGMALLSVARSIDPFLMTILVTAKEKNLDRYKALEYGAFDVVEKNIRGTSAVKEIITKTRAAVYYRNWTSKAHFLARYFDPRLVSALEKDSTALSLGLRTVTICFWDVRGFSLICEQLKAHPQLIAAFLREYCNLGAKIIFNHGGVLDKFIGDGIMAIFGVPNHKGDKGKADAIAACRAAIELRKKFDSLASHWLSQWRLYTPQALSIGLGCGIHTGEVLVGTVGTEFRDQFTALGHNVNFASRIEARATANQILVSQSVEARVRDQIRLQGAGTIGDIKNIPGTFPLYEVVQ